MLPNFAVSHETEEKLKLYDALLHKWQAKINLVGPSTLADSYQRHFIDSLQLCAHIPPHARTLYDLGSGAGFPGLVLAAAFPVLDVHLIESDQRKCVFLQTVSREAKIPAKVHTKRIEAVDLPPPDVITARALAEMSQLFLWTEKWWSENAETMLVLPKGAKAAEEISYAKQLYSFDVSQTGSVTDPSASLCVIRNLRRK